MSNKLPILKIGKYQPRYPLIQGGMGVEISGARLAGNVALNQAIGTIASVGLIHKYLDNPVLAKNIIRDVLQRARNIAGADGIIAINCMAALTDHKQQVIDSAESGVNIIISGAGLPLQLPEYTSDFPDIALVPIVSSVKAARLIIRRWEKHYKRLPDAFIVEDPGKAGGHLGVLKMEQVTDPAFSLAAVIPELVAYINNDIKAEIPVVAAGGIWDRNDMLNAFALGASGVQMGTRFACTEEGDASDEFKRIYINAREEDVMLISSPAGLPGRVIRSPLVERSLAQDNADYYCMGNCLTQCRFRDEQQTFCIALAMINAFKGDWENGLFFCGSNVKKVSEITTVKAIIQELFPE